jgi:hypothetical protein
MTAQRYELILETRQTEQFFLKEKQAFLLHFARLFVHTVKCHDVMKPNMQL